MDHKIPAPINREVKDPHDEINHYIKRLSRHGFPVSVQPRDFSPLDSPFKERSAINTLRFLYFRDLETLDAVVRELETLPRSQVTEDTLSLRLQTCKDSLLKSLPSSQKTNDQQAPAAFKVTTSPNLNDRLRQSR
jgi:hypothetical protein